MTKKKTTKGKEPVLVIHGVANRDEEKFIGQVSELGRSVGGQWNFVPVYWGDLGAEVSAIEDTLPQALAFALRATGQVSTDAIFQELLSGDSGAVANNRLDQREIVIQAAKGPIERNVIALQPTKSNDIADAVQKAIEERWDQTIWLKEVKDQAVLEAVGQAVGEIARRHVEQLSSQVALTGFLPDQTEFAKSVLDTIDTMLGMVIGKVGGILNQYFRKFLIPGIGKFLGDVFVYQRHRKTIQDRIWAALKPRGDKCGTNKQPISVIAHSLGGVIAFDMAVAEQTPLWIKAFVTFGSQSSFFHVLDPRGGVLSKYSPGIPVPLPATIAKWTNLWEPVDPLAFVAGKMFILNSGARPKDIELSHQLSSGLWTHSVYWTHPELIAEIRDLLSRKLKTGGKNGFTSNGQNPDLSRRRT